ncbi:hypothetical protein C0Q70_09446 [Pomacea canaliculata]|uniref:Beta-lactamase-related domain-containing protein n=2 Tax=Pomacea canaliculata TaxID=400727 RepID=A0A2T7P9T7_POMCA|nr:hypothetical protein C0Q70_09446 [Pomacea canaliculata]
MAAVSRSMVVLAVIVCIFAWRWVMMRVNHLPPVTEGYFHPAYRPVAELFRKFVEDGVELGGSFSVYQHGTPLIDLWGGYADAESHRPWREDTLTMIWSSTKGATALAVAKLVDKGLLDYKKEVYKYWPEFAQNGKSSITVEMLLSHQSGMNSLGNQTISLHDYMNNWTKVENIMATAPPDFSPGTRLCYQSFTFSMYIDALIRRVDPQHRNLSQFFHEEIALPYGIDIFIGLPQPYFHRAARQKFPPQWKLITWLFDTVHRPLLFALLNKDSVEYRSAHSVDIMGKFEVLNDPHNAQVGLGSAIGFGTARALAQLYDYIASGGSVGNRILLPADIVKELMKSRTDSLPSRLKFTVGLMTTKNVADVDVFGHSGFGGQQAWADPVNKLGIGYVTNHHSIKYASPSEHYLELLKLFYDCYKQAHAS